jgi:TPR repeat protein
VELYETSCSKGNSSAKEATVRLSDTGFLEKSGDIANGEEKYDDAFFYFNRGYELKDPECTFKLAQLYLNGQGVTRSADECIKLLKESSDAGHKESTLQLGRMYLQGNDIVRNIDTAVMLLKKAATQGSSDACLELGGILESDDSTVEEALVWYNKGSEMGSLECKDKAIKLQKQISESKMSPQDSLDRAKVLLESGDKDEALRLLNKASDGGYAEAKFIIGEMYFNGCILPRSEKDAIKFIKESADLGYSKSQTFLANLYLRGRGVPRSLSDAIRLFESASASGDVEAIKSLAAMYNRGEGVQRSVEKAAEMYEMAANAGDAESQFITGCNYQNGKGVGKSEEIAIKWLKAAYENGVKEAKVQLRMLRINEV